MIDYQKLKRKKKLPRKKAPLSQLIQRSVFSLIITLTIINAILLTVFIIYNSNRTQMGNILTESQNENKDLELKQKILESKLIELKKSETINDSDLPDKMSPATDDISQYIN